MNMRGKENKGTISVSQINVDTQQSTDTMKCWYGEVTHLRFLSILYTYPKQSCKLRNLFKIARLVSLTHKHNQTDRVLVP